MPRLEAEGEGADDVFKLRERLWSSRRRRTRYGGIALLTVGSLSLALVLITRELVFEIAFLLSVPLGILVMFMTVEPYVRAGTANAVVMSSLLGAKALLGESTTSERPVFEPTEGGVQVRFGGLSSSSPTALPELAKPLTRIYELEMGDLSRLELGYLFRNLPKVIVDGLQLADAVRIEAEGDGVSVAIERPTFWPIYLEDELRPLYERIGCPLAWSVGEALAKCSGRLVSYLGYELSRAEMLVRYRYMLGRARAPRGRS